MAAASIGNTTKRYSVRCNPFTDALLQTTQQQQWTKLHAHAQSTHTHTHSPRRFFNNNLPHKHQHHHLYTTRHRSHSYSTTSSPETKSKTRFIGWYLSKLESNPIATKTLTTSLIYAASDLTAQMITPPSSSSFDFIRTLRMAGYGFLLLGPSQHLWFGHMSKILPNRDLASTLKKIFLGQVIYGPANAIVFYSYNAALQGESGSEILARLKRDVLPTLKNGLLFWPVCDFVVYKFVPVHLQPLMNSMCAYLWTIYLTYMASLEKTSTGENKLEWRGKVMRPMQRVWNGFALRLGFHKPGLWKLQHDVRACQYKDVQVMWEMIRRNGATGATFFVKKKKPSWKCFGWVRCSTAYYGRSL